MHASIGDYLTTLQEERRSALTVRAVRSSLLTFTRWWEDARGRAFDPALVRTGDVEDWRLTRQRDEGAAPATINRGLSLVRGYGAWATRMNLIPENPAHGVAAVPTAPLSPKGLPAGAVDALLREAHTRTDTTLRRRDEALLALLAYACKKCAMSNSGIWTWRAARSSCATARPGRRGVSHSTRTPSACWAAIWRVSGVRPGFRPWGARRSGSPCSCDGR